MSDTLNGDVTPTITFNEIPADLQRPGNYIEILANASNAGILPYPARALIVSQMRTGGTGAPLTVYNVLSPQQAAGLFGAGSPATQAVAAWFAASPQIPLDVLCVQAPAETAVATGTFAFTGTASAAALQPIGVAGQRIAFAISPTDTLADIATNCVAAIMASPNYASMPVTVATNGTAGQVLVTARTPGAVGNSIDLRDTPAIGDADVPGIAVAVTPMTGGVWVPDITALLALIATTWYTSIATTFADTANLGLLCTAARARYTSQQTLDTQVYAVFDGTQGQIATLASSANLNCQFLALLGVTNFQNAPWEISASLMAVAEQALLNDPARQLRGLVLPGIIAPAPADVMTDDEQEALLLDGVATFDVNADNEVVIQRLVTNYTTAPNGVPDTSWQDVMTPKTLTRIRYDWKNYLAQVYPRNKLADDNSVAAEYDASVVTPRRLKGAWAARCSLYERAGWIEGAASSVANSTFVRDANYRNRVNAQLYVTVIGNLMVDAMQLIFTA